MTEEATAAATSEQTKKRRKRRRAAQPTASEIIAVIQRSIETVRPSLASIVAQKRDELRQLVDLAAKIGVDVSDATPTVTQNGHVVVAPPPDARNGKKLPPQLAKLGTVFTRDDVKKARINHMKLPQWTRAKLIAKVSDGVYRRLA